MSMSESFDEKGNDVSSLTRLVFNAVKRFRKDVESTRHVEMRDLHFAYKKTQGFLEIGKHVYALIPHYFIFSFYFLVYGIISGCKHFGEKRFIITRIRRSQHAVIKKQIKECSFIMPMHRDKDTLKLCPMQLI